MRSKRFRFQPGDIVQVSPGLEFASPLTGEERREQVEIVQQQHCKQNNLEWNSYVVRSVSKPGRLYVLQENFLRIVRPKDGE